MFPIINTKLECSQYETPLDWNFALSINLCVGILVSYIPQHIRIIKRRSSEGISAWFLLLGITSGFCALFNILLVSRDIYACCRVISAGNCFSSSLGILQIFVQSFASVLILVFALTFTHNQPLEPKEDYKKLQFAGKTCLTFFTLGAALSTYVYFANEGKNVRFFANILGVLGAVLAGLQYFPQIYTTTHLKHVGSLSIPMMLIQTPGGFLWSASLAMRKDTIWSSWLPYFTAACLQGILLVIACYYEIKNKNAAKRTAEQVEEAQETSERETNVTETTPLI